MDSYSFLFGEFLEKGKGIDILHEEKRVMQEDV